MSEDNNHIWKLNPILKWQASNIFELVPHSISNYRCITGVELLSVVSSEKIYYDKATGC